MVKPLGKSESYQTAEVSVTDEILCQQGQVMSLRSALSFRSTVMPASAADIDFAADERLDVGLGRGGIKLYRSVHDSVIGDRNRVLSELFGSVDYLLNFNRAVEYRILRVKMEMYETTHWNAFISFRNLKLCHAAARSAIRELLVSVPGV